MDWHEFFTKTLVDIFVKHVKLYRRASELLDSDMRQQQRSFVRHADEACGGAGWEYSMGK